MYGLRIIDPTYWDASWSAAIGRELDILNSTYNLFVFKEGTNRKNLQTVLKGIPAEAYNLLRLRPSSAGCCEILTDSGQCYTED